MMTRAEAIEIGEDIAESFLKISVFFKEAATKTKYNLAVVNKNAKNLLVSLYSLFSCRAKPRRVIELELQAMRMKQELKNYVKTLESSGDGGDLPKLK